jgi:hypothetical protein
MKRRHFPYEVPAPVPKGPWSDATDGAGTSANPWANSAGPWGRH